MKSAFGLGVVLFGLTASGALAQESDSILDSLIFHASFDESPNATFAVGDGSIYTAESLRRASIESGITTDSVELDRRSGRFGGSLHFKEKTSSLVFFKGGANVPATDAGFSGSIAFWMSLTPHEDLPPGYVDPLQITDKKWNDASFFVDFTETNPRDFRLGVFSDYAFWNPSDTSWDQVPDDKRPLVTIDELPFERTKWTHIGITFEGFNLEDSDGIGTLYIDGQAQGQVRGPQQFTWDADQVAIMLGINYVGRIDDLAVFDRCLTPDEMKAVFELTEGISSLPATPAIPAPTVRTRHR